MQRSQQVFCSNIILAVYVEALESNQRILEGDCNLNNYLVKTQGGLILFLQTQ
jgi:hypothetical protein